MNPLAQLFRLIHIQRVLIKHGLDEFVLAMHLFRPLRFLRFLLPWNWFRHAQGGRGMRLRKALEELGPLFVKFGQILSTRKDLLPSDIAEELSLLQDRVRPFSGQQAQKIVEDSFGSPIAQVFQSFELEPLASASIAQVHKATLLDGTHVIVKVVRPDIEKTIARDVSILRSLANLAQRYSSEARRLRVRDIVDDYERTIVDELDMLREAASATQLRRNFAHSDLMYVPEVYWDYTRKRVLVMERISGIAVDDVAALAQAGVDLKALAEHGVEIFFTQVFRHNFFHADMHPGNIFVDTDGKYIAIDFGIMGTLSVADQRYLAENFHAFFKRDYRRVAELHVESNWVPKDTRVDEFEAAIRTVCEPIFDRPLKDISFGYLLVHLFQTARRFNMEVQPQLVLLQKTLLNIEGLGRQLYPELDLWKTAKPFLEQWMNEQVGPKAFFKAVSKNFPYWVERMPEMPGMVHDYLESRKRDESAEQARHEHMARMRRELRAANRHTFRAITGTGFVISATLIMLLHQGQFTMLGSVPLISLLLGGLGAVVLVFSWPVGND